MSSKKARDWYVYVLRSTVQPGRTYCGSTNNLERRLRQHNGELVGGARCTAIGRPWKHAVVVSGLTKHHALQLEWRCKVGHNSADTFDGCTDGIERRAAMLAKALDTLFSKTKSGMPKKTQDVIKVALRERSACSIAIHDPELRAALCQFASPGSFVHRHIRGFAHPAGPPPL